MVGNKTLVLLLRDKLQLEELNLSPITFQLATANFILLLSTSALALRFVPFEFPACSALFLLRLFFMPRVVSCMSVQNPSGGCPMLLGTRAAQTTSLKEMHL